MTDTVIATLVAPSVGVAIGNLMFLSHAPAIRAARRSQALGAVNPDPFPMIVANCMAWCLFGALSKDVFVVAGNLPGAHMALFYTLTAYGLTDSLEVRRRIERLMCGLTGLLSVLGWASVYGDLASAVGVAANVICMCMFAAPLSQIGAVVRERDSSSIDRRFMVMQNINCTMWVIYGAAVGQWAIVPPNSAGLLLGLIQLAVICRYPKPAVAPASAGKELAPTPSTLTPNTSAQKLSAMGTPSSSVGEKLDELAEPAMTLFTSAV